MQELKWHEAVEQLSAHLDVSRIPARVRDAFASDSGTVGVACSGGADSILALLLVLSEKRRCGYPWDVTVLHFNHALRGADSEADEAFVRQVASELDLRFVSEKAGWDQDLATVTEEQARDARLAFFERAMGASANGRALIVTGHHSDDVVETLLMRVSRGAGVDGLCAPRPVSSPNGRIAFLRPLLGFSRAEAQAALKACGLAWREDRSNRSDRFYRNRLREAVVPAWEKAADRLLSKGVARSRQLLEEDAEALRHIADTLWRASWSPEQPDCFPLEALRAQPVGVRRRLLQRFSQERAGVAIGAEVAEHVLEKVEAGQRFSYELATAFRIVGAEEAVLIEPARNAPAPVWGRARLVEGTLLFLPTGACVAAKRVQNDASLRAALRSGEGADDESEVYIMLPEKQSLALWVRQRKPGDAVKPFGKSSPKKLQELFIERKICRHLRNELPVFTLSGESGDRIAWVPGLPPAGDLRVGAEASHALQLTYQK